MTSDGKTTTKTVLYGALPAQAILQQFDGGQIVSPQTREQLLGLWGRSNQGFLATGPGVRSYLAGGALAEVSELSAVARKRIEGRIRSYPPFDSHPFKLYDVELAALVTPQLNVTDDRVDLRGGLSSDASLEEKIRFCFEYSGSAPLPIMRQTLGIGANGGAYLFSSEDEDIRLHQPPIMRVLPINDKDPDGPSLETICFPVGGGTPFIYALRIPLGNGSSRLIVANGIHRIVGAMKAGHVRLPIAICDLSPLELPPQFVEAPTPLLLDPNANPPMMRDFLDPSLALRLTYRKQLRLVRFNWNFEQLPILLQ